MNDYHRLLNQNRLTTFPFRIDAFQGGSKTIVEQQDNQHNYNRSQIFPVNAENPPVTPEDEINSIRRPDKQQWLMIVEQKMRNHIQSRFDTYNDLLYPHKGNEKNNEYKK